MALASGSVAVKTEPTLVPAGLFSATARVAVAAAKAGASFTSLRLTVTAMLSVPPLPSVAVTASE